MLFGPHHFFIFSGQCLWCVGTFAVSSPVHGGSELSLRVLCDRWQTLCPWQWECCCLLPLIELFRDAIITRKLWLVVWTILFPHLGEKLLKLVVKFLGFIAYNIWTVFFFFSLRCPNSTPGLSAFLCVRISWIFLKLFQFFYVTIGKYIRQCFKIRNNNFSVTMETGCNFLHVFQIWLKYY